VRSICVAVARLAASLGGRRMTYLIRKGASTEVTKGELESSVGPLNIDLQSDESVRVCR